MNNREDFCVSCVILPVAALSATGAASTRKKTYLIAAGVILVVGIALSIYFFTRCKSCSKKR